MMKTEQRFRLRWAILFLCPTLLSAAQVVVGDTYCWDTSAAPLFQGGPGRWADDPSKVSWSLATSNGTNPTSWRNDSDARFPANTSPSSRIEVYGYVTANTLAFTGTGYSLERGDMSLLKVAAGITAEEDATINVPLSLWGTQTWSAAAGKTLMVNSISSVGTPLTIAGDGNITITGPIENSLNSLTKTGSGVLTLTDNGNGHSGTTINGGAIAVSQDGPLGAGPLTFNGGALRITSPGAFASVRSFRFNSAGGTLQVEHAESVATLAGALSGPGGLTKTGAGKLVLTGNSAYRGPTVILAGTLEVNNAPATPVAGSSLWLDASDPSTVLRDAGNFVSQWNDNSAGSRNAVQGEAASRPVYATSAQLGGKPVLRFDGANDQLNVNLQFLNGKPYTIFAVEGRTSGKNGYFLGSIGSGDNQQLHVGYRNNTAYTLAQYNNDLNYAVPGFTSQSFRLWTNVLDTAGHSIFLDGGRVKENADKTPLIVSGITTGRIGNGFMTDNTQCYQGELAEILIYNTALKDADRQTIEAYLRAKWFGSGTAPSDFFPDGSLLVVGGGAALNLVSGAETVGPLWGQGTIHLNSAALTVNSTADSTFAGTLAGFGGLTKTGPRTLALSGENQFTGGTEVVGGMLLITSPDALPAGGGLTIGAGASVVLSSGLSSVADGGQSLAVSPTPVPEPSCGVLASVCAAFLWILTKRRQDLRER